MSDRKIKRLLNKEADALLREKKHSILQEKVPAKQKSWPRIKDFMPAVSVACALLFVSAFAVVCYIPVALKNNGDIIVSTEEETVISDTTAIETADKEFAQSENVIDNSETNDIASKPDCDLQDVCDIINRSSDFNDMAKKFEETGVKIRRQYMATFPGTAGEEDRLNFSINSDCGGYHFQRLYMRMLNKDIYITANSEITSYSYCIRLTEPELEPFFCREKIITPEYVADNLISIVALSCSSADEELVNERQKQYKDFVITAIKHYMKYLMGEVQLSELEDYFILDQFIKPRTDFILYDSYSVENINVSGVYYEDYYGSVVYCRVTYDTIITFKQKDIMQKSDFNVELHNIDGKHKIYSLTSNPIDEPEQTFIDKETFRKYIKRERAGEKLSEEEIEEIKNYIDSNYCGIDLEYERASYDDRMKAAENGEFSYASALTKEPGEEYVWSRVLVWDDLKNLGLKDYYEYPRLTLQTVCDIISENDGFDEIIYRLAEVDKFFSSAGCTASGETVYRYDIKLTGEKCYEFINIYPDRGEISYHKVINDPESKDYHNPYAVCIFSKDEKNTCLTPDSVKENLNIYVK